MSNLSGEYAACELWPGSDVSRGPDQASFTSNEVQENGKAVERHLESR
jgi:hypothetical protein